MSTHKTKKGKILSLVVLMAGLWLIVGVFRSTYSLFKRDDLFIEREKKIAELKEKNQELRKTLEAVQGQEFIEKEAREKLGMGKEGEVVVILPKLKIKNEKLKIKEEVPNWRKWYNLFFY